MEDENGASSSQSTQPSQAANFHFVGQIGSLPEFDERKEDFVCYMERLEQFFLANSIAESKKVASFLSAIGSTTYQTLRNLASPDLPSSKSYDELKALLMNHFNPKPSVIAERCKFNNCYQRDNQDISEFIVEIKKLSEHCAFGTFLNDALRDRLVCGLHDRFKQIQLKLLVEEQLDFKKACDIALNFEMARKDTREMHKDSQGNDKVNKVRQKLVQTPKGKPEVVKKPENTFKSSSSASQSTDCYRCGGKHSPQFCKWKNAECFHCHKTGHLAKVCRSKNKPSTQSKQTHVVNPVVEDDEDNVEHNIEEDFDDIDIGIFKTISENNNSDKSYLIDVEIDGVPISMELDTGAVVSIIPESMYREKLSHLQLKPTNKKLQAYGGEQLSLLGELEVNVKYGSQQSTLPLVVIAGTKQALLGRNWLQQFKLDWASIFTISHEHQTEYLLNKYKSVFEEGYGKIKDFQAHVSVKENASPVFFKPRPIPYALRDRVEAEIDRLLESEIIEKVDRSEWAAPVVVVPKADGSVRLCGDYKVTVNKFINEEQYPLPTVQDLLSKLAGGTLFSKMDLTHAYQQLELDEQSQKYLTINTHLGLFSYNRLPFGVSSAPSIFQKVMDQVLQGIPGVVCFFDDILVTGQTPQEHMNNLEEVLQRLEKNGIRAKLSKCSFLQKEVEYLGYKIDAEGLHPTDEKTEAIVNAPRPTNVTELKSYLGLLNYYGKFIRNLADVVKPLNELQQKGKKWEWSQACEHAFKESKQRLLESQVLVHYDVNKPLRLACDASPYGVGAVLSHVMPNGEERPVAFASRTLHQNEQRYAQLEKEALAIIFGVKKFHQYLYGRKFNLVTDHQPLVKILGPHEGVPTLAAARLQRWALILSAYQYDIVYRRSEENANADAMSRLPHTKESNEAAESNIFKFCYLDELPLSAKDISESTRKDPVLSKVYCYIMEGWPKHVEDEQLVQYFRRRHELSAEQGCILWGLRVVIPPGHQARLLDELHEDHPGMSRMKSLARSYFWWPGLDQQIENKVKQCLSCQLCRNAPPPSPLHPWKLCDRPMQRIHIDFAELNSKHFMRVTDAYSKWLEVYHMTSTTATKTIEVLRNFFAQFGLPEEVVSDNGPPHTSAEFCNFLKANGIKQTLIPAYHPASNGAAERSVQTVKAAFKKQVLDQEGKSSLSLQHRIANFVLKYRITPHTSTGRAPAELFLKRLPRTKFSLLKPSLLRETEKKQLKQKEDHDKHGITAREFTEGQHVLVRNNRGQPKWLTGTVLKRKGPLTYLVRVQHKIRYVHVDHLLESVDLTKCQPEVQPSNACVPRIPLVPPYQRDHPITQLPTQVQHNNSSSNEGQALVRSPNTTVPSQPSPREPETSIHKDVSSSPISTEPQNTSELERRYPVRQRKAPDRLNL